jgi:hypothetical protein
VEWFPNKPPPHSAAVYRLKPFFEVELSLRKEGMGDPQLVYDEQRELFRFRDGKFAFSRKYANWRLL